MKTKKTCIHTEIVSQVNNLIKIVSHVYLVYPESLNLGKRDISYSRAINFTGWEKVAVVSDKHKVTTGVDTELIHEYEIWVNGKNLDYGKSASGKYDNFSAINNEDARYKMLINYTTTPMFGESINDSNEAECWFDVLCNYYEDQLAEEEDTPGFYNMVIKCKKYKVKRDYNTDGSLKSALALDNHGRVIFGIIDTHNIK